MARIPSRIHFIWLGSSLPALAYLAIRSALDRAGADHVILHHGDPELGSDPLAADLASRERCQLRSLNLEELLGSSSFRLKALYESLDHAPSRANLLRLLILWKEGGIYLDTDVITLRDLSPLRDHSGFAGLERIAFPAALYESRNPLRWVHAGLLTTMRDVVRRVFRDAGSAFRRIERLYPLATNNAVLGAEPGHATINDLLARIGLMDSVTASRRFRLGPQLLERATGNRSTPDFHLFEPAAFYPLAPEICMAYVRHDPRGRLGDTPHPDTFAAHVYDSVLRQRGKRPLNAHFFRNTRGTTLLARMVEPYLDDLFALTPAAGPHSS